MELLHSFADILREYPALAIFLTIGLGFLLARLRIGSFSLGNVTSVLLVAVLVGQLDIPVSGPVKMMFFMLFLFSIGYSVGPDFFRSLRGQGARQALFAVLMSMSCAASVLLVAWLFGYTKGETIGLFSGSQTCSALIGVGTEAIGRLGLGAERTASELDIIPVCYAVTYIFGTVGTVVILGNIGPWLLGGIDNVRRSTAELEKELNADTSASNPARVSAMRRVAYRTYIASAPFFDKPVTVRGLEHMLHAKGIELAVDRIRHGGEILVPRHDQTIHHGDTLVLCGTTPHIMRVPELIGPEVADAELLDYPLERVSILVVRKGFTDVPLADLRRRKYLHGVVIRDAVRDGKPLPVERDTVFRKGDKLTVLGRPGGIGRAAMHIGHVEKAAISSDLMFLGLAIFIGGLFGSLSFWIDSVPVSFGTSGGSLLAGLIFGWLRSRRPTYGHISQGALWIMNNMGLTVFIAVVGLEAAPSFVSGIKAVGPMLFVAGATATVIPLCFGLWLGHKVFKFAPAITLGCCAGTRTCTASLGAVQDALDSTVPAMGYTVCYAVANLLLVVWGLITVMVI